MSESDETGEQSEGEAREHPLKEGIDEAKAGETASLEDILLELD